MNRYLLFIIVFFILIPLANSSAISNSTVMQGQSKIPKYYMGINEYTYEEINTTEESTVVISYNTSSSAILSIINSSNYIAYVNGNPTKELYNSRIQNMGVKTLNVPPGSHYVILKAEYEPINYSFYVFVAPVNKLKSVNFTKEYIDYFNLTNYTNFSIDILSNKKINLIIPNYYNYTIQPYQEFQIMAYLNKGPGRIILKTNSTSQVFFYINSTNKTINPISLINKSSPNPIGIASYGTYMRNGRLKTFTIKTKEVIGTTNITSIYAYSNNPPQNTSPYGASIQLNAMMNVISNNKTYQYWLQDVMSLNTSSLNYQIYGNIWNDTKFGANLSKSQLVGSGYIGTTYINYGNSKIKTSFYGLYNPNNVNNRLSYPIYFSPVIAVNNTPTGPKVYFGYYTSKGYYFFNNVTIKIPNSIAYIEVTPYYEAGNGNSYNVGLVFGGASNDESSKFYKMNSTENLYYLSDGNLVPFPYLYTFGVNTGESASGINTSVINGNITTRIGNPNYNEIITESSYNLTGNNALQNESKVLINPTPISKTDIQSAKSYLNLIYTLIYKNTFMLLILIIIIMVLYLIWTLASIHKSK